MGRTNHIVTRMSLALRPRLLAPILPRHLATSITLKRVPKNLVKSSKPLSKKRWINWKANGENLAKRLLNRKRFPKGDRVQTPRKKMSIGIGKRIRTGKMRRIRTGKTRRIHTGKMRRIRTGKIQIRNLKKEDNRWIRIERGIETRERATNIGTTVKVMTGLKIETGKMKRIERMTGKGRMIGKMMPRKETNLDESLVKK